MQFDLTPCSISDPIEHGGASLHRTGTLEFFNFSRCPEFTWLILVAREYFAAMRAAHTR